ncbi:MAG: 3-deoxy-D-manno-octulosonic acid transferase [Candidatus Omnitrophica bacterium]|nr:3-deoxy-D-manno-octulosonic acid transferase [Candidatus Omnitrophota bacterium]MDD5671330.1 3-deoxy-D-manno-octulosonic acid transferase [Candidatus Omnitrophota bacterium]
MIFLYNLAFVVFAMAYLPIFLLKMRQADDKQRLLKERLGLFSSAWKEKLLGKKVVWIHAVSVGEVLAVQKFIERFLEKSSEFHIVLSTVTPTGQKIAKKMENERITVCYFPFDVTGAVRSFFKTLGPECLLLVETEIWPNLLMEAKRFRVPVGILNARLSIKSARRYDRYRHFFRPLFSNLAFVLAQSAQDAERFTMLGVDSASIQILGNMKFDNVGTENPQSTDATALRNVWGFDAGDQILIAGSTHPGEEEIVFYTYRHLLTEFPHLKLLIAPRHIERSIKILQWIQNEGGHARLASDKTPNPKAQVLLLDRLGVLKNLYAMADAVFVGGSLIPHGGQNPIEAAVFGRTILHGPYVANFENIYRTLDQEGGAILVRDEFQFSFALRRLLQNAEECRCLGDHAYAIVRRLRGSTQRHVEWLLKFLNAEIQPERNNHVSVYENIFSPSR